MTPQIEIIKELSRNRSVFHAMLAGTPRDEFVWKPAADKWSLIEVLSHLVDEERGDFRARVSHSLQSLNEPLPPIDPVGWVRSRKYLDQNFDQKLEELMEERRRSIKWLNQLESPVWENFIEHPALGKMTAKGFLANWLAHDQIHIRQIVKIKRAYFAFMSDEDLTYAGNW